MRRTVVGMIAAAALCAAACSKESTTQPGATGEAAVKSSQTGKLEDHQLAKIPILPGYKYYVGGPLMKRDPYGKYRIAEFQGEVAQPPSRGMVFGAKREGDKMEYRAWGNGILLSMHRGVMRDGVFWQDFVESYKNGKLVARERNVNDDEAKATKITTEDIDPENGEVIRTKEGKLSYFPPKKEAGQPLVDEDEEEAEPIAPAAPAAPAAAPPPPGAK